MEAANNMSFYRLMRVLHRDIGFFVIGLTVIYCISGIVLTYRDTGFLKSTQQIEKTLEPGLRANQLGRELHLKGFEVQNETEQEIQFKEGTYNKETGLASYQSEELPGVMRLFNNLHFVASKDLRHWFTSVYAMMLLFLALSSFWMYKPGSKYFKRGLYIAGTGGVLAVLLLFV